MHSDQENLSYGLSEEMIAARVSRLLNQESVEILSWKTEMISFRSYAPSTRYMLNISGVARTCSRRSNWRMLVKVLQRPAGESFESGWDREVKAYELLVRYVSPNRRLRVPRFLGADRPSDESARLWIEYVEGRPARHWEVSTWGALSAGLAILQSKFLEDRNVCSEPWLNHNDLRQWVETDRANMFPIDMNDSTLRLTSSFVDADVMRVVSDLWRERNRFMDRLDSLTQTICHNDVWSGNAVAENVDRTRLRPVIFDWQLVGPGPLGSDLAFAVAAGVWLGLFPGDGIGSIESSLLSGYESGLKESGCEALIHEAKEAFALTAAMRYAFMLPQLLEDLANRQRLRLVIEDSGLNDQKLLKQRADLIRAGVTWALR